MSPFSSSSVQIHPLAEVADGAQIGEHTRIWHFAQVREGARIGRNCIIGKGVYIDTGVRIGDNVKVQNHVSLYDGVIIEDGAFIGPHVCFSNDLRPRAVCPDGSPKGAGDWAITTTLVRQGASIGSNSTIVCGVTIGRWAMVGAGGVVTRSVPDYGLVLGNPARLRGFVCPCGERLSEVDQRDGLVTTRCAKCGRTIEIPAQNWAARHGQGKRSQ